MPTTETKRFLCRHIFANGYRCNSPALRGATGHEPFCYFHHTSRRPIPTTELRARKAHRRCREPFNIPLPEDLSVIQISLGDVLQRIAANEIDPRRARLLLYGLQLASQNIARGYKHPETEISPLVEEVTFDPDLGPLAPEAEVGSDRPKGPAGLMLEKLRREFPPQPETPSTTGEPAEIPEIDRLLRSVQASSSPLNHNQIKNLRKNRGRAGKRSGHPNGNLLHNALYRRAGSTLMPTTVLTGKTPSSTTNKTL